MNNSLQQPRMTIAQIINAQIPAITKAIGGQTEEERKRRADRFARICLTAVRMTPKLEKCTPESFAGALMTCAQLDLEPNTPQGLAYLIPYGAECQFQIGYKGLMQLMYRSGLVASFNADVVYRGEVEAGLFRYESGVRPSIEHRIDLLDGTARTGRPEDIVAAYAAVVLKTGEPILRLVTRKDIEDARRLNRGASPAWKDHYAAMAIKTAIKRLAAWMPQTEMIALAVESDSKADRDATPEHGASISVEQLNSALATPAIPDIPELPEPAPEAAPAPEPAPEEPVLVSEEEAQPEPKEDPVAKRSKKETYPAKETPQLRLYQALAAPCDGDEVEMQKLLNAITNGEKYSLADIPSFTDFVAERLCGTLEEHLQKLGGDMA